MGGLSHDHVSERASERPSLQWLWFNLSNHAVTHRLNIALDRRVPIVRTSTTDEQRARFAPAVRSWTPRLSQAHLGSAGRNGEETLTQLTTPFELPNLSLSLPLPRCSLLQDPSNVNPVTLPRSIPLFQPKQPFTYTINTAR